MKKNIQYQFGASLFALAFSLGASLPAAAQTCVPPPSCDTLGFTKTAADCAGKTILKCPFDKTKVYCPGVEEQTKMYALGDTYFADGVAVGKVIKLDCPKTETTCSHGVVATVGTRSGTFTEAGLGCASIVAGGLNWFLPTSEYVTLIGRYIGIFSYAVWGSNGECVYSSGGTTRVGCDYFKNNVEVCGEDPEDCIAGAQKLVQGYYCVAAF